MTGSTNGDDNPTELTIDSDTGIFTLVNVATIKTTYEVEIDVLTTDGINHVVYTVSGMTIDTICGPDSTTLTAPIMPFMTKAPNTLPVLS